MIDPKRVGTPPRMVRLSGSYVFARNVWIVVALITGLMLASCVAFAVARRRSLAEHSIETTGRVVQRYVVDGKNHTDHVIASFETPKGSFDHDFSVSDETYELSKQGTPFPVFYDQTDPTSAAAGLVSREEATDDALKWWLAWAAGGVAVAFVFSNVSNAAKEQARRLAEWPLGELRVSRVSPAGSRNSTLSVSGSYLDPEGKPVQVTGVSVSKSVHVEEPIPILCDPFSDEVVPLDSLGYVELA